MAVTTLITELIESVEATLEEANIGTSIVSGLAETEGVTAPILAGATFALTIAITNVKNNKEEQRKRQEFVTNVNNSVNEILKTLNNKATTLPLTSDQLDITNIFYEKEITSYQKQINDYNEIIKSLNILFNKFVTFENKGQVLKYFPQGATVQKVDPPAYLTQAIPVDRDFYDKALLASVGTTKDKVTLFEEVAKEAGIFTPQQKVLGQVTTGFGDSRNVDTIITTTSSVDWTIYAKLLNEINKLLKEYIEMSQALYKNAISILSVILKMESSTVTLLPPLLEERQGERLEGTLEEVIARGLTGSIEQLILQITRSAVRTRTKTRQGKRKNAKKIRRLKRKNKPKKKTKRKRPEQFIEASVDTNDVSY